MKRMILLMLILSTFCPLYSQNTALQFTLPPTTGYVRIADSASLDITQTITLEAFIKLNSLPQSSERYRTIIAYRLSLGGYCLFIENDGTLQFFLGLTGADVQLRSPLSWNTGQWYHIAGVYDGTRAYLFRDGVLITQTTPSGTQPILTGNEDRHIGGWQYPWEPRDWFDGVIDEVRISSTARYTANFSVPTSPFTTDSYTAGLWHFDEGTGNTAGDSSGNNNTGYIYGATWVTGYPFGGTSTPTITVLSPNGGETWTQGTTQTVTWTWSGTVGPVNIDLSTNGGTAWTNLVQNTSNDGSQTLTVPNYPSTTCRIRVAETDGTPSDISDNNFSIVSGSQTNNPPSVPTIESGPSSGLVGQNNIYSVRATDPEGDQIFYTFDWDDGSAYLETGLVNSGELGYGSHIWQSTGTFNLKVKTTDSKGLSSAWSGAFPVTITQETLNPVLSVSAGELNFGKVEIGQKKTLKLAILNSGNGTLSGMITSNKNWIKAEPSVFSGNDLIIDVTVDNRLLGEKTGEYEGKLQISSNGGDAEINIKLTATCILVKPNPFNPKSNSITFFGSGITAGTVIKVYTIDGKIVKELYSEDGNDIVWDGKDESGKKVIGGIYIYTYESNVEKGAGKFTVIQ